MNKMGQNTAKLGPTEQTTKDIQTIVIIRKILISQSFRPPSDLLWEHEVASSNLVARPLKSKGYLKKGTFRYQKGNILIGCSLFSFRLSCRLRRPSSPRTVGPLRASLLGASLSPALKLPLGTSNDNVVEVVIVTTCCYDVIVRVSTTLSPGRLWIRLPTKKQVKCPYRPPLLLRPKQMEDASCSRFLLRTVRSNH